ncbi:unnamed protein product [Protopolystoma xenopodis]|uniref:Uncharacterized protein n=1 Tax=Protopolystoma xenopodis TaxID=117903 RepID=A0A3S5AM68_9PLAT|nr:unnamed protein product [Protopolystoma xenopodis]
MTRKNSSHSLGSDCDEQGVSENDEVVETLASRLERTKQQPYYHHQIQEVSKCKGSSGSNECSKYESSDHFVCGEVKAEKKEGEDGAKGEGIRNTSVEQGGSDGIICPNTKNSWPNEHYYESNLTEKGNNESQVCSKNDLIVRLKNNPNVSETSNSTKLNDVVDGITQHAERSSTGVGKEEEVVGIGSSGGALGNRNSPSVIKETNQTERLQRRGRRSAIIDNKSS